jgi:hypothetical protein
LEENFFRDWREEGIQRCIQRALIKILYIENRITKLFNNGHYFSGGGGSTKVVTEDNLPQNLLTRNALLSWIKVYEIRIIFLQ